MNGKTPTYPRRQPPSRVMPPWANIAPTATVGTRNEYTGSPTPNWPELRKRRRAGRGWRPMRKEAVRTVRPNAGSEVSMDEMTVDELQAHLDGLTEIMTGLTAVFEDEKMTNGTLSEASQEALLALKLVAAKTQLSLLERGVPMRTGEVAT